MAIAVGEAVTKAWDRMVTTLFKPFAIEKWFIVGFAAWLAYLFEDGEINLQGQIRGNLNGLRPVLQWMGNNLLLTALGAVVITVLLIALTGVLAFLRARGQFMLLHALTHEKFEIGETWSEYANEANSAFKFFFAYSAATMLIGLTFAVFVVSIAYNDIVSGKFGGGAIAALALGLLVGFPGFLLLSLIGKFVRDFVLPLMFVHRIPIGEAWGRARHTLIAEHKGELVLFYLLGIALGLAGGVVIGVVGCVLCCISWIPYISTVLFLPIFVFFRCYSLCFLQQLGPEFWAFPELADRKGPPICPACGYDLRGNPFTPTCPECGIAINPDSFDLTGYARPAAATAGADAASTPAADQIDDADLVIDLEPEKPKDTGSNEGIPGFPQAPPAPDSPTDEKKPPTNDRDNA